MEAFVPPVVFGDAKPLNSWTVVKHEGGFFLERKFRDKVVDSFFNINFRIIEWVLIAIFIAYFLLVATGYDDN
jgi:hypothetical protein